MKYVKRILIFLILALFLTAGYTVYKGYRGYREALEAMSVEEMGEKIMEQNHYTFLEDLPELYKKAVLAVEDHRFYSHPGIDPIAIGRALFNDLRTLSFAEGGSTITQQLAKNQYFTQDKNIFRKVSEIFMAFKIESVYDKDTILELYLNSIYFGNGYYSVADAARGYFDKTPMEMTEDECTLLAGIPNAPSAYNPLEHPERARRRQEQVLERVADVYGTDALSGAGHRLEAENSGS